MKPKWSEITGYCIIIVALLVINYTVTGAILLQAEHRERLAPGYPVFEGFYNRFFVAGYLINWPWLGEYVGWSLGGISILTAFVKGGKFKLIGIGLLMLLIGVRVFAFAIVGVQYLV